MAEQKNKPEAISTKSLVHKKLLVNLIRGMDFRPMIFRKLMKASTSASALSMKAASFGTLGRNWSDLAPLLVGGLGIVLNKGGADEDSYDTTALRHLGDAGHAHGFDQIIDRAGQYAMHILLHHRTERLLGQPARLQEAREVAAFAQFGVRSSIVPARVSHSRSR